MASTPPVSEATKQIQAERAAGIALSALEEMEIKKSQALLDARMMPSVILEGEMGTGKTFAGRTLLMDAKGGFDGPSVSGIERICMLAMEPGWEEVLGDIPPNKLSVMYIPVSSGTWEGLKKMVSLANTASWEALSKMGGVNRHLYPEFDKILGACANFIDERTGEQLGPIFKFPQNWCFWFESISAFSEIAKNNAIGDKPMMIQSDYQLVQFPVLRFMNHVVFGTKCLFVATAHLEREQNTVNNQSELMISTVGRQIGYKLPRFFSDVIITDSTHTQGASGIVSEFSWATVKPGVRTKTRNLPWSSKLPPDFRPLIENFRKRTQKGKVA